MLIFWILLAAALIIIAVIVSFSHLTVKIFASRVKENDRLYIQLHALYGIIRLRYEVPAIKFKGLDKGLKVQTKGLDEKSSEHLNETKEIINWEKIQEAYRKFKIFLSQVDNYAAWMKSTLSRFKISQMVWITRIGAGDAPETALLTGVLWSVKSTLLGYLLRHVRLQTEPEIQVQPQYNRTLFTTEVTCIAKIRLGYAMVAGLMLLVRTMKVKGGFKTWQNILSKA